MTEKQHSIVHKGLLVVLNENATQKEYNGWWEWFIIVVYACVVVCLVQTYCPNKHKLMPLVRLLPLLVFFEAAWKWQLLNVSQHLKSNNQHEILTHWANRVCRCSVNQSVYEMRETNIVIVVVESDILLYLEQFLNFIIHFSCVF